MGWGTCEKVVQERHAVWRTELDLSTKEGIYNTSVSLLAFSFKTLMLQPYSLISKSIPSSDVQ